MAYVVPPPPLPGVGTSGDVTFLLEDRQGIGEKFLAANTSKFIEAAEKRPEIADISNFMSPSNLQYNLNVNTEQATLQNMDVDEIYATIQAYMGSTFLNNFNIYGQEWQVYMQADAPYRDSIDKLSMFYVRNNEGDPVPLDSVINVTHGWAPEFLIRQNMFNSSQLNVTPAPGYSSGPGHERPGRSFCPDHAVRHGIRLFRDELPGKTGAERYHHRHDLCGISRVCLLDSGIPV